MEDRTLTERVQRVERILAFAGIGGEEFSGCDQAVTGADAVHMLGMDKSFFAASSAENTQRFRNESLSARIKTEQPPQHTAFEEIIHRIHTATDRILRQACALEDIGSRILGSLPEDATGKDGGEARGPDGTLDQTHEALNGLDYACARLEAAALRLERI